MSKGKKAKKVENERLVSALSYILIGIIWYFADENMSNSSLAKFHVKQAINLWLFLVLIQIVANLMLFFGMVVAFIGDVLVFVLLIFGIINAVDNKERYLPVIGKMADKYLNL